MDRTNVEGWGTTARGASSWGRMAAVSLGLVAAIAGCGGDDDGTTDASTPMLDGGSPMGDAGMRDDAAMGMDAGTPEDAGETDAGETDAGGSDAGGCPVGMTGPDCEECAPGYVDRLGMGECLPTCEVEDAIACGDHGTCMESPLDGSLLCHCDSGYEGASCDMCEEGFDSVGGECELPDPPALGLSLWLDADAPDSLTLGASNEVLGWADRRSFIALEATPTTGIARPTFQPTGRNGRGAVDFDGVDDQLALNGYNGLSATDFEILFAGEPSGATPIGLVGALSGTSDWAVMIDRHESNDFRFTFRRPPGTTGGETVVVDRMAPARPMYVVATHQSSGPSDSLAIFASDDPMQAAGVSLLGTSGPIAGNLNLRIGRTQAGRMNGKVYEILIYTRRLSVDERAEVTSYLRAKWNLP